MKDTPESIARIKFSPSAISNNALNYRKPHLTEVEEARQLEERSLCAQRRRDDDRHTQV
jgi:hypothetical protein